ncbi:MAG TPA: diguanylate cyclase [Stenotrophomonas sp.]|nr:diguanylate cyclase [Stenotrophomonas sp.]
MTLPWPVLLAVALLAMLALAALWRWRRRRLPRLEHITHLQDAAASALADPGTLPCSLIRLQLRGPGARHPPLAEVARALRARARRGGDHLARSGSDGFALWLGNTHAEAAQGLAEEIRADLAPLLVRHDLRCSIGTATATASGGRLQALWEQATPPGSHP